MLTEIADSRVKRQQEMEDDERAEELAARYAPENCFGDVFVTNLDCHLGAKDLGASGTIYNNGSNIITNIEARIFLIEVTELQNGT